MARLADLSVEYAHLYLRQVTQDSALEAATAAQRWAGPVIERYRERGLTVTTSVMIDDYFTSEVQVVEEKTGLVEEACAKAGLAPDFIVYEGACAETVHHMLDRLVPEPRRGDGSATGTPGGVIPEWISNGQPGRAAPTNEDEDSLLSVAAETPSSEKAARADGDASSAEHSNHLDVELYKRSRGETIYACPTLAAWWQLIRLGMLRDASGEPTVPARTRGAGRNVPFAAQRTLTVLGPRFIEVEHAVRTILGQVNPRPEWLASLRLGRDEPGPDEPLKRIAYLFVPDGFDPPHVVASG